MPRVKALLGGSILDPHDEYRMAIGVLGVGLPVALLALSGTVQGSISAYYHTPVRDWFVGTLWVIGVFLFFYRYEPQNGGQAKSTRPSVRSGFADAVLGKLAGISAVGVALFPTPRPMGTSAEPQVIGWIHGLSAAVLFACLAGFPLVLFSQSRDRVRFYQVCGWTMVTCLLVLGAHALAPDGIRETLAPFRLVLVLEWVMIWAFGFSWFAKGLKPTVRSGPPKGQQVSTLV